MEGLVGYDAAAHNGYLWLLSLEGGLDWPLPTHARNCFKDYIRAARDSSGMPKSLALGFGMGLLSIHLMMLSGAVFAGFSTSLRHLV